MVNKFSMDLVTATFKITKITKITKSKDDPKDEQAPAVAPVVFSICKLIMKIMELYLINLSH